jgi:hypothetical protein
MIALPDQETIDHQPVWLKCGFVQTWRPAESGEFKYKVTLILFNAVEEILIKMRDFIQSDRWTEVLSDPYAIVNWVFSGWYECLSRISWDVTKIARLDEKVRFYWGWKELLWMLI